ncbi:hypothetical protein PR048_028741 [Dryococelus australis]|uniref:MoaB/Mog domain-containing protein n=1 Tax=Dryococelus australis TaxID=614101 RepID=A0ABQ9GBV0_9NEOP|nr:hypothetical protein PR048_028741 [Dryococelus australis]
MLTKMKDALSAGDVVVTTGSVSMGERDILKEVLVTDLGATVHFGRVFMKPGSSSYSVNCRIFQFELVYEESTLRN